MAISKSLFRGGLSIMGLILAITTLVSLKSISVSPTPVSDVVAASRGSITKTVAKEAFLPQEITGALVETYVDHFDDPTKSEVKLELWQAGQKKSLTVSDPLNLPVSGSTIKLKVKETAGGLLAEQPSADWEVVDPAPVGEPTEERRVLVLAFNFLDSPDPPFTAEEVEERVFGGSVKDYYLEQSYGALSLTGDAYGPFTLPRNGITGTNCLSPSLVPPAGGGYSEVGQFIVDNNINMSQYDNLVIVAYHPCQDRSSSSIGNSVLFLGLQSYVLPIAFVGVDSPENFTDASYFDHPFPWTNFDYSFAHELGHGFGLRHSQGLNCADQVFSLSGSGCSLEEYGNRFDLMAVNQFSSHFSAFLKEKLGWFTPQDYLTISQTGTYTINPIELAASNKKAAKIRLFDGSEPFFLEYRRPIGFDSKLASGGDWTSNTEGLLINQTIINPTNPNIFFPRLLDLTPNSSVNDWEEDVVESSLNGEQRFTVPEYGLQIGPIVSSNPDAITFKVRVEPVECVFANPLNRIIVSPPFQAGVTSYLTARIENTDSVACGETTFNLSASLPAGWTHLADAPSGISLDPGAHSITGLNISVATGTPNGLYPVNIVAQNNSSGLTATRNLMISVAGSPIQINSVAPNPGFTNSAISISGSGLTGNGPNFVSLANGTFTAITSATYVSNSSISFVLPSIGLDPSCSCEQPLLPGNYQLTVSNFAGTSNALNFIIND